MADKITPAQRRALVWLAQHDGPQKLSHLLIDGGVSVQTVHSLSGKRLISARYAQVWGSGARPIETVSLTAAGRKITEE